MVTSWNLADGLLRAGVLTTLLAGAIALGQQTAEPMPAAAENGATPPSAAAAPAAEAKGSVPETAGPSATAPSSTLQPAPATAASSAPAGTPNANADAGATAPSASSTGGKSTASEGGSTAEEKTIRRFGPDPWEYSAYRVNVWVAAAPSPYLDPVALQVMQERLADHIDVIIGAPWRANIVPAPEALYHTVALCPELVTESMIAEADKNLLKQDKLFLVSLRPSALAMGVWVREFDCHARTWGPIVERELRQPEAFSMTVFDTLVAAFAPLARIEDGHGKVCVVRGRATGLVTQPESPVAIGKGDVFQPVFRQNDRYGEPQPGRVEAIPFTFIQLTTTDPQSPTLWNGNVHSGMRNPIHGRSPPTSRRERWALKVRPLHSATTVFVESKPIRKGDQRLPLGGIEVFAKTPEAEPPRELTEDERKEAEKKNPPELLGLTDWRGTLEVPHSGPTLRIAYLKNGGLLLARLPIVPGLYERVVAEIPDDNPRLQAEGFVRGMNSEVMDLVVQRQLLALRMRRKLQEGKFDEAEKFLEDFRDLKTLNDLQQMLNVQLQRQKPTNSVAVRQRIEKLYSEERELITKYIDAELQVKLSAELAQARANPPEAETEEPSEAKEEKKSELPSAVQPTGTAGGGAAAAPPVATGAVPGAAGAATVLPSATLPSTNSASPSTDASAPPPST